MLNFCWRLGVCSAILTLIVIENCEGGGGPPGYLRGPPRKSFIRPIRISFEFPRRPRNKLRSHRKPNYYAGGSSPISPYEGPFLQRPYSSKPSSFSSADPSIYDYSGYLKSETPGGTAIRQLSPIVFKSRPSPDKEVIEEHIIDYGDGYSGFGDGVGDISGDSYDLQSNSNSGNNSSNTNIDTPTTTSKPNFLLQILPPFLLPQGVGKNSYLNTNVDDPSSKDKEKEERLQRVQDFYSTLTAIKEAKALQLLESLRSPHVQDLYNSDRAPKSQSIEEYLRTRERVPGALDLYESLQFQTIGEKLPHLYNTPKKVLLNPVEKIIRNSKTGEFISVKRELGSLIKRLSLSKSEKSTFHFDETPTGKKIHLAQTLENLCVYGIPKEGRKASAVDCNDDDQLLKWNLVPIIKNNFWIQQTGSNFCLQPAASLSYETSVQMSRCDLYDTNQLWEISVLEVVPVITKPHHHHHHNHH